MTITLHSVNNESDWPSYISDFARSICRPLPASFVPHLGTTSDFEQFARAVDPCSAPPADQDLLLLSEVFSLSVRDLQHASLYKTLDNVPHSIICSVYTLIKALTHVLEPTLSLAADMSFLTPRGSSAVEGVALAVVSHVVSKEDRPRPRDKAASAQREDKSMSVGGEGELVEDDTEDQTGDRRWDFETRVENQVYEACGPFFRIIDHLDEQSDAASSIDLPLDAHVEASSGRRTYATLPVTFAADWANILLLTSSVLYQRKAWSIDCSAVGFCVSDGSPVVRLTMGWLDATNLNEVGLPQVHIAISADSAVSPAVGAFDLSSISGALSFAQLFLSLRDQHRSIAAASTYNSTAPFIWRRDSSPTGEGELPGMERIAQWARDVDLYGLTDPSPTDSFQPLGVGCDLAKTCRAPQPSPTIDTADGSQASESSAALMPTPPPTSQLPDLQWLTVGSNTSQKSVINAVQSGAPSHSKLALKNNESIVGETMTAFLFDRNVCFVSRHGYLGIPYQELSTLEGDPELSAIMTTIYDDLTQFLWPEEWASDPEQAMPCAHFLHETRKTLCAQYRVLPPAMKHTLEPEASEIVRARLLVILLACAGQYTILAKLVGVRTIKEAEALHDWDSLLFHFYVDRNEQISPNVLLERELQTCPNQHFDLGKKSSSIWVDDVYKFARRHYIYCLGELRQTTDAMTTSTSVPISISESESTSDKPAPTLVPSDPRVQAQLRSTWETNITRTYTEFIRTSQRSELLQWLTTRTAKETLTGTCDVIAIDSIGWTDEERDVAERYRAYMAPRLNSFLGRKDNGQGLIIGFKTFLKNRDHDHTPATGRGSKPPPHIPAHLQIRPDEAAKALLQRKDPLSANGELLANAFRTDHWKSATTSNWRLSDPFAQNTSALATAIPEVLKLTSDLPEDFELLPDLEDLWVPTLVGEYKTRDDVTPLQAANQARSYLCSCVNYLEAVGILDHPVWALVTNGAKGAVIMGWKSSKSGNVFILERDVCIFDISVPLQAYQFAVFLVRLRMWAKQQRDRLKEKVVKHFKNADPEALHKWTKESQALQHFDLHNPKEYNKRAAGQPAVSSPSAQ